MLTPMLTRERLINKLIVNGVKPLKKGNLPSLITETLYHSHSFLTLQSLSTFTPRIFSGISSSANERNLLIGNKNHKKLAGFVIHSIHTTIEARLGDLLCLESIRDELDIMLSELILCLPPPDARPE